MPKRPFTGETQFPVDADLLTFRADSIKKAVRDSMCGIPYDECLKALESQLENVNPDSSSMCRRWLDRLKRIEPRGSGLTYDEFSDGKNVLAFHTGVPMWDEVMNGLNDCQHAYKAPQKDTTDEMVVEAQGTYALQQYLDETAPTIRRPIGQDDADFVTTIYQKVAEKVYRGEIYIPGLPKKVLSGDADRLGELVHDMMDYIPMDKYLRESRPDRVVAGQGATVYDRTAFDKQIERGRKLEQMLREENEFKKNGEEGKVTRDETAEEKILQEDHDTLKNYFLLNDYSQTYIYSTSDSQRQKVLTDMVLGYMTAEDKRVSSDGVPMEVTKLPTVVFTNKRTNETVRKDGGFLHYRVRKPVCRQSINDAVRYVTDLVNDEEHKNLIGTGVSGIIADNVARRYDSRQLSTLFEMNMIHGYYNPETGRNDGNKWESDKEKFYKSVEKGFTELLSGQKPNVMLTYDFPETLDELKEDLQKLNDSRIGKDLASIIKAHPRLSDNVYGPELIQRIFNAANQVSEKDYNAFIQTQKAARAAYAENDRKYKKDKENFMDVRAATYKGTYTPDYYKLAYFNGDPNAVEKSHILYRYRKADASGLWATEKYGPAPKGWKQKLEIVSRYNSEHPDVSDEEKEYQTYLELESSIVDPNGVCKENYNSMIQDYNLWGKATKLRDLTRQKDDILTKMKQGLQKKPGRATATPTSSIETPTGSIETPSGSLETPSGSLETPTDYGNTIFLVAPKRTAKDLQETFVEKAQELTQTNNQTLRQAVKSGKRGFFSWLFGWYKSPSYDALSEKLDDVMKNPDHMSYQKLVSMKDDAARLKKSIEEMPAKQRNKELNQNRLKLANAIIESCNDNKTIDVPGEVQLPLSGRMDRQMHLEAVQRWKNRQPVNKEVTQTGPEKTVEVTKGENTFNNQVENTPIGFPTF